MPKHAPPHRPRVKLIYDVKKSEANGKKDYNQIGEAARHERLLTGLFPHDHYAVNIRDYTSSSGFYYPKAGDFNFHGLPTFCTGRPLYAQVNHSSTAVLKSPFCLRDIIRHVRKLHDEMEANTFITTFDQARALKNRFRVQAPWAKTLVFHDDTPRQILAADGSVLVASFPNVLSLKGVNYLNESIGIYTKTVPPRIGARSAKEKEGTYLDVPNQMAGEVRICRGWHQIGQTRSGVVSGSKDAFGGVVRAAATSKFLLDIQPTSWAVNEAVRLCDPRLYINLHKMRKALEKKHPVVGLYGRNDPLLLEGRELLFNRWSGLHTDNRDPPGSFAGLLAAGDPFSGGDLHLPTVRAKFRFWPGDLILIRGKILRHEVESWEGGQRICIPHFTHTSVWEEVGLQKYVGA